MEVKHQSGCLCRWCKWSSDKWQSVNGYLVYKFSTNNKYLWKQAVCMVLQNNLHIASSKWWCKCKILVGVFTSIVEPLGWRMSPRWLWFIHCNSRGCLQRWLRFPSLLLALGNDNTWHFYSMFQVFRVCQKYHCDFYNILATGKAQLYKLSPYADWRAELEGRRVPGRLSWKEEEVYHWDAFWTRNTPEHHLHSNCSTVSSVHC